MLSPIVPIHPLGFVPDMAPNTPGAIVDMSGFLPTIAGMRTLPGLRNLVLPLAGGIFGIATELTGAGAQFTFAGNKTHLYVRVGATWQENDGGQVFNIGQGRWRFAQFLDDMIAVDGNAGDPGGGVQVSAAGGVFAPLAGNPPAGKFVAVTDPGGIAAVAFIFNTVAGPQNWYASAPGNDQLWSLNQIDQSFTGVLGATPGPITGASNLRQNMVAFKAASFYFGQYIGGQFGWQFQPTSYQVGCASNEAIVNLGDFLVFPGPDDFYMFDGQSLNPIPNALRQFYFSTLDVTFAANVQGVYFSSLSVVLWSYPSKNQKVNGQAVAGLLDSYIMWNQKTGMWSAGKWGKDSNGNPISIQGLIPAVPQTQPLTYGQFGILYQKYGWGLDGSGNPILVYPGPPLIPPGLLYGSASFEATPVINPGVVLSDGGVYVFSGPPQGPPRIRFGDIGDLEHYLGITRVKAQFSIFPQTGSTFPPLPGARLTSYTRDALGSQTETIGPAVLVPTDQAYLNDDASFDIRETARWHQFEIECYSDSEINGIAIEPSDEGIR